jgi:hypothetical protein
MYPVHTVHQPRPGGIPANGSRTKRGEQIRRALLGQINAQGQLEWTQAFLDGSFVPAKRGL